MYKFHSAIFQLASFSEAISFIKFPEYVKFTLALILHKYSPTPESARKGVGRSDRSLESWVFMGKSSPVMADKDSG